MIDGFMYSNFRLWYHSRHTSLLEQLILKTICDEVRCSGVEEVLTAKIYDSVIPKAVYEGKKNLPYLHLHNSYDTNVIFKPPPPSNI